MPNYSASPKDKIDSKIFQEFKFLSFSFPPSPTCCLQLLRSLEVVECSREPTISPVPFLSYSLSLSLSPYRKHFEVPYFLPPSLLPKFLHVPTSLPFLTLPLLKFRRVSIARQIFKFFKSKLPFCRAYFFSLSLSLSFFFPLTPAL